MPHVQIIIDGTRKIIRRQIVDLYVKISQALRLINDYREPDYQIPIDLVRDNQPADDLTGPEIRITNCANSLWLNVILKLLSRAQISLPIKIVP